MVPQSSNQFCIWMFNVYLGVEKSEISVKAGHQLIYLFRDPEMTQFLRFFKGLNFSGILAQVFLPIITAFSFPSSAVVDIVMKCRYSFLKLFYN